MRPKQTHGMLTMCCAIFGIAASTCVSIATTAACGGWVGKLAEHAGRKFHSLAVRQCGAWKPVAEWHEGPR